MRQICLQKLNEFLQQIYKINAQKFFKSFEGLFRK